MLYCDSHIEFFHHPDDLAQLPKPEFLQEQVNPTLIERVRPSLFFAALYVEEGEKAWERLLWVLDSYQKAAQKNGWIIIKDKTDLQLPGIKMILHIENLHAIGDDLDKIDHLHSKGIRSVGLTHNHQNKFAGGSLTSEVGLSPLGGQAIEKIESLGMILDFAHLSTQAFKDVFKKFESIPFVSHTGIQGVYNSPRNLPDEILDLIKERGGYVGVGVAGSFLAPKGGAVSDLVDQFKYAIERIGVEKVGIGSDLGGTISYLPEGLGSIMDIFDLEKYLPGEVLGVNLLKFIERSGLK